MTEELDIFNFNEKEVRIHRDKNGKPWFVAKDVCDVLGLSNITEALRNLDGDELTSEILKSGNQGREMKLVSESGLYALVIRSNKPNAKKFRKWITSEVLPSIRKTGGYIVANPDDTPEEIMARAQKIADDVLKRREESDRISSSILLSALKGGTQTFKRDWMGCPVLVDTMTTIFNIDDMNSVFLVKEVENFYTLSII